MNTLSKILLACFTTRPIFANVAVGVHAGSITKNLEAAASSRHLIGTLGSTESEVDLCDADTLPLGVITDEGEAGDPVCVALLSAAPSTLLMVASGSITAGSPVFTDANGKVQDQPTDIGTYYHIGYALTAASADTDTLEVCPIAPRKTKVIESLSESAGTDIAALGAALGDGTEKIIIK